MCQYTYWSQIPARRWPGDSLYDNPRAQRHHQRGPSLTLQHTVMRYDITLELGSWASQRDPSQWEIRTWLKCLTMWYGFNREISSFSTPSLKCQALYIQRAHLQTAAITFTSRFKPDVHTFDCYTATVHYMLRSSTNSDNLPLSFLHRGRRAWCTRHTTWGSILGCIHPRFHSLHEHTGRDRRRVRRHSACERRMGLWRDG